MKTKHKSQRRELRKEAASNPEKMHGVLKRDECGLLGCFTAKAMRAEAGEDMKKSAVSYSEIKGGD